MSRADAFTWTPPKGVRWGLAWHDIWPYICSDNLGEMKSLRRRYARRMTGPGRQCCWSEGLIR